MKDRILKQRMSYFLCLVVLFRTYNGVYADQQGESIFWSNLALRNIERKLNVMGEIVNKPPKNIILFVGDGMGQTAITASRVYRNQKLRNDYIHEPLNFEKFSFTGIIKTHSTTDHVTDSAAGAIAYFTGNKGPSGYIGVSSSFNISTGCNNQTHHQASGQLSEAAIGRGMNVGLVTTTRLTHATPAALYAKGVHRNMESRAGEGCESIARQILKYPANQFKVMFGGGSDALVHEQKGDVLSEWRHEGKSNNSINRAVVQNLDDLNKLSTDKIDQVLGLFHNDHIPLYVNLTDAQRSTIPRLWEMTQKAIELLSHDNKKGYFLLIEGGHIDTAQHFNLMKASMEELLEMDLAVKVAREMTSSDDTLIIVTADHSHAVSLPGYMSKDKDILDSTINLEQTDGLPTPGIFFATGPNSGDDRRIYTMEQTKNPLFAHPAAIGMLKGAHGGEDVPLYADGPWAQLFTGSLENAEVGYLLKYVLCLNPGVNACDRRNAVVNTLSGWIDMVGYDRLLLIIIVFILTLGTLLAIFSFILLCKIISQSMKTTDSFSIDCSEKSSKPQSKVSELP